MNRNFTVIDSIIWQYLPDGPCQSKRQPLLLSAYRNYFDTAVDVMRDKWPGPVDSMNNGGHLAVVNRHFQWIESVKRFFSRVNETHFKGHCAHANACVH